MSVADTHLMNKTTQAGFTLVELLIALAVAAILLGIGIPSFSSAIKNSQVSSDYNELVQSLYIARSEAVKTSSLVAVCPKYTIDSTECGTGLHDWKNGWLVFMDNKPVNKDEKAQIGTEDRIISVHDEMRSKNTIEARGSADRTKLTATDKFYIQFQQNGESLWGNGTFELCNSEDIELSRAINIAPTGDVRPGRPSGSKHPRDVFGDEVC